MVWLPKKVGPMAAEVEEDRGPKRGKACGTLLREPVRREVALACGTVE